MVSNFVDDQIERLEDVNERANQLLKTWTEEHEDTPVMPDQPRELTDRIQNNMQLQEQQIEQLTRMLCKLNRKTRKLSFPIKEDRDISTPKKAEYNPNRTVDSEVKKAILETIEDISKQDISKKDTISTAKADCKNIADPISPDLEKESAYKSKYVFKTVEDIKTKCDEHIEIAKFENECRLRKSDTLYKSFVTSTDSIKLCTQDQKHKTALLSRKLLYFSLFLWFLFWCYLKYVF